MDPNVGRHHLAALIGKFVGMPSLEQGGNGSERRQAVGFGFPLTISPGVNGFPRLSPWGIHWGESKILAWTDFSFFPPRFREGPIKDGFASLCLLSFLDFCWR